MTDECSFNCHPFSQIEHKQIEQIFNVAERMKVGSDESQKCVSDVKGVSKKIDKILSLINQISHLSHQISTAAEQQAMVAKEININSYQIFDASKVNLREINTITETISEMTQNSAQLVDLSKAFK